MNGPDGVFKPPRFSSQELAMMFTEDTIYPELQFSLMITQEFCEDITFKGKFPLMRNAGDEAYNAWVVDPNAPPEFWVTRRQEILEGKVSDGIFVPLVPDGRSILRHPIAVANAIKLQAETRRVYGDGFRFVFTRDPDDPEGDRCIIRPYVFTTPDSYLSNDGSSSSPIPFSSESRPLISTP